MFVICVRVIMCVMFVLLAICVICVTCVIVVIVGMIGMCVRFLYLSYWVDVSCVLYMLSSL